MDRQGDLPECCSLPLAGRESVGLADRRGVILTDMRVHGDNRVRTTEGGEVSLDVLDDGCLVHAGEDKVVHRDHGPVRRFDGLVALLPIKRDSISARRLDRRTGEFDDVPEPSADGVDAEGVRNPERRALSCAPLAAAEAPRSPVEILGVHREEMGQSVLVHTCPVIRNRYRLRPNDHLYLRLRSWVNILKGVDNILPNHRGFCLELGGLGQHVGGGFGHGFTPLPGQLPLPQ